MSKSSKELPSDRTGRSPGSEADQNKRAQQAAHLAEQLRNGRLFASMMVESVACGTLDTETLHAFIDGIVQDLGNPTDPLVRILTQQLAFAHLRLAGLQGSAASAKSVDASKAYNAGCARLLAEIRRTALTIDQLRDKSPVAPRLKLAKTG